MIKLPETAKRKNKNAGRKLAETGLSDTNASRKLAKTSENIKMKVINWAKQARKNMQPNFSKAGQDNKNARQTSVKKGPKKLECVLRFEERWAKIVKKHAGNRPKPGQNNTSAGQKLVKSGMADEPEGIQGTFLSAPNLVPVCITFLPTIEDMKWCKCFDHPLSQGKDTATHTANSLHPMTLNCAVWILKL